MSRLKRSLLALAVAASLFGAAPTAGYVDNLRTPAVAEAHSCSSGYTHAVIGGSHKCLRAGQYCARRYARSYPRYGFSCRRTSSGYRLVRR